MNKKIRIWDKIEIILSKHKKWKRLIWRTIVSFLIIIVLARSLDIYLQLQDNSGKPVDAFFVLGGSIGREIYVAKLARANPEIPILISQGSKEPCIWLIFQKESAPLANVWIEKCADSTFDNFVFGLPILKKWGVHKVKIITSSTHLPRAQWMSQIFLGSQGIWAEIELAKEIGIPGNNESFPKTILDVTRSFLWAAANQVIAVKCNGIIRLIDIDMQAWREKGFKCERHQDYELPDSYNFKE
jgi:uncharacterized SAM-binding protein YcdF (DUF218 family)